MDEVLYIGIGSHVVAIEAATGDERWRAMLRSDRYVSICVRPEAIYAGAGGRLYCVDRETGGIRWEAKLKGLGLGLITFGESSLAMAGTINAVARAQADEAASASAAT